MNNSDVEKFKSILKQEKLKFTPQRFEVFKEVCSSNEHREAEEIYHALRERNVYVSRATIYRTMDMLFKYDLVRRMDIGDGRWRYERRFDCSHHDHLICIRCGKIVEFTSPEIEDLQQKVCNQFEYKMFRHTHQLFGICKECVGGY